MVRFQGRVSKRAGRVLVTQLQVIHVALLDLLEKKRIGNRRLALTGNDQQRGGHHAKDDQEHPDIGAGAADRRFRVPCRPSLSREEFPISVLLSDCSVSGPNPPLCRPARRQQAIAWRCDKLPQSYRSGLKSIFCSVLGTRSGWSSTVSLPIVPHPRRNCDVPSQQTRQARSSDVSI